HDTLLHVDHADLGWWGFCIKFGDAVPTAISRDYRSYKARYNVIESTAAHKAKLHAYLDLRMHEIS
ncbi:hypothetical protein AX14_008348, partial [Amanita brunnescens Koide BX004]